MMIDPMRPYRRRRRVKPRATAVVPVERGPVLVVATFDGDGTTLALAFDRDVNFVGFEPERIVVDDAAGTGGRFVGVGIERGLRGGDFYLAMQWTGPSQGQGVTLTAGADTGIVAMDGGEPWAGADAVQLPFGTASTVGSRAA